MITQVIVRDKKETIANFGQGNSFKIPDDVCIISITNPTDSKVFNFMDGVGESMGILELQFSDITPGPFYYRHFDLDDEKFINSKQARQIVDFVLKLANEDFPTKLWVHCSAGICRSGAIGLWALKHSEMKEEHFIATNPQIKPNEWVLWKLIEAEMESK